MKAPIVALMRHLNGRRCWPLPTPTLSVRLRLTLLYTVVLAVSLLAFGLALEFLLERALSAEADQATVSRAQETVQEMQRQGEPLTGRIDNAPDVFVQVIDAQTGRVIARSTNLDGQTLPLQPDTLAAVVAGRPSFDTVGSEDQRLRVYSAPIVSNGQVVAIAMVARSLATGDRLLQRLQLLLITMAVVGLPLVAGLGWTLAGRALAPIEKIARVAEAIGRTRAFSERIADDRAGDELGRLAATINAMLTELEAAHHDIASANARLEQTLAAHRRFVADASHELRTPLTTIRINAELLRAVDGGLPQTDHTKALEDITGEAERMSRLVNDLLTLARADAGQRLVLRPTPLRPLVEDAFRQAQLLAVGQRMELIAAEDVEAHASADALRQLLLILLDNAIKNTPPGGLITLALRAADDTAQIRVTDTGIGIEPASLPRIFERFYRTDTAREGGGSGLGLAIARWIVEQHAGQIEVESQPGRGSAFAVRLPATRPGAASAPDILTAR